jgi:predicted membrane protein (TIGR00267 family)
LSASTASEGEGDSRFRRLRGWLFERVNDVGEYMRVTRAQAILRRYFAVNAFDGAMTSLGVVIGAYIVGLNKPGPILGVILMGGFAMAVSGFSGTYLAERAERERDLNDLEGAMLIDLKDTIHGEATRYVSLFAALIDGAAPFLASMPALVPFALSAYRLLPSGIAFPASIASSLLTLFLLGVYLGRVSGENLIYSGLKMVAAGVAVALLAFLINGGH